MNRVVVDASALLAIIQDELPSAVEKLLAELLNRAVISTVNLVEVRTKLIDLGKLQDEALNALVSLGLLVEPFTLSQAQIASGLRASTRHLGLSLGDRACIALALDLGLDVYTCDQAWSKAELGCQVHQLR